MSDLEEVAACSLPSDSQSPRLDIDDDESMERRSVLVLPSTPPPPTPRAKHSHHSSWSAPASTYLRPPSPLPPIHASTSTLQPKIPVTDVNQLPLLPLPSDLAPFLAPSILGPTQRKELFTQTFLRAASSGNTDTLEWLLSTHPVSANGTTLRLEAQQQNASAASKRFSSSSLSYSTTQDSEGRNHSKVERAEISDSSPRKWVDLEACDHDGTPAIVLASALGHSQVVSLLIEAGANVGSQDSAGWSALHWAVQNNG